MKQSGKILIYVQQQQKNEQEEKERNRNRYLIRLFVYMCVSVCVCMCAPKSKSKCHNSNKKIRKIKEQVILYLLSSLRINRTLRLVVNRFVQKGVIGGGRNTNLCVFELRKKNKRKSETTTTTRVRKFSARSALYFSRIGQIFIFVTIYERVEIKRPKRK